MRTAIIPSVSELILASDLENKRKSFMLGEEQYYVMNIWTLLLGEQVLHDLVSTSQYCEYWFKIHESEQDDDLYICQFNFGDI